MHSIGGVAMNYQEQANNNPERLAEPHNMLAYSIQQQALHLKSRIDWLTDSHELNRQDADILEDCLRDIIPLTFPEVQSESLEDDKVDRTKEKALKIASVTTKVAIIEDKFQESSLEKRATNWITLGALCVLLLLLAANLYSNYWKSTPLQFQWPNGWFINSIAVGFVLAGATINILFTHIFKVREQDWKHNYRSLYGTRLLTAVVYAAVLVQFSRFYLAETDGQQCKDLFSICISPDGEIVFISSFFIGLFVNRINDYIRHIIGIESQRKHEDRLQRLQIQYDELISGLSNVLLAYNHEQREVLQKKVSQLLVHIQRGAIAKAEREYLGIIMDFPSIQQFQQLVGVGVNGTHTLPPEEQNRPGGSE
jgi:hypothetical protein